VPKPSVLLIAMPWHWFSTPSLQLGLLQSVLQRVGVRRPGLETADYSFDEREAQIYLACEDGATAAEVLAGLGPKGSTDLDQDDVTGFLDEPVELRLAFEEGGRYLALALPPDLRESS
jgi:hypothetical protein